jgi:hypothetical protein
MASELL